MISTRLAHLFCQVLVMTHELSNPEEYDDYLARVLAPAPVQMLLGRSRDSYPPCRAEECLWWAWKDLGAIM